MATSLADSPPASPPGGQAPRTDQTGSAAAAYRLRADCSTRACVRELRGADGRGPGLVPAVRRRGAGQPWHAAAGAQRGSSPALVAVLVLGAAAAARGGLTKGHSVEDGVVQDQRLSPRRRRRQRPRRRRRVPRDDASTPGTVPSTKLKLPSATVIKPPKIPLTQVTPKASETPPPTPTTEAQATTPTSTTPKGTTHDRAARARTVKRPTKNAAGGDPARHERGLHIQPIRIPRDGLRRSQPGDRRRHLDGVDRGGQPGDRAEDGARAC